MNNVIRGARASQILLSAFLIAPAFLPASAFAGGNACVGLVLETGNGGILDEGWSGRAHDTPYPEGNATSWAVARRCSNNQALCTSDDDCAGADCVATCDCQADSTCELTGPVDGRKCLSTMADCTTNADCPSSVACVSYFGPPLPVSHAGTPLCLVTHFEGAASGTFDAGSGDLSLSATLRRRIFLGDAAARPCPRCGAPDQNPMVGGEFVCEGGRFPGAACIAEAVHPWFGGTSTDCPPTAGNLINGAGVLVPVRDLGTGTTTRTAQLPCTMFGFTGNPTVPGSNPKCTDNLAGPVCTSNADCSGAPVTCGFWCHCGFCNGNGNGCFDNGDCAEGQTCQKGSGTGSTATSPQALSNDCSADGFVCGTAESERCESSSAGSCSDAPYRECSNNSDCASLNAGLCQIAGRPCFESEITRSGSASPLGSYCAVEDKACSTNADCSFGGDSCVPDSTRADLAALYCLPSSGNGTVNTALGLPGPGAAVIPAFAKVCRCSGSEPGCEDVCEGTSGCGNGTIEQGEQCDGGACCNENCTLSSSAVVCRAAAGSCDTAESCTGSSAACPADSLRSSSTMCRSSAGVCDVAELCSGASPTCPADGFAATTTACRASTGDCDATETCSGTAATCPADASEPDGTGCNDGNACTSADQCSEGSCEGTPIQDCGGECGDGSLDEGEACDGGACCNDNCTLSSSAVVCRASAGICDAAESCTGVSATCPADSFASTATACRASTGDCDATETCSGTSATCPSDASEPDGTDCNDGSACTSADQCSDGSCEGTPIEDCSGECGDGSLDEGEACDDGNATFTNGEYCGVACVLIPCGKPTNSSGELPKTSDALFVLRTAVGQATCSPRVCSPDGNQTILSSDALRVLRAAVGQPVALDCPTA